MSIPPPALPARLEPWAIVLAAGEGVRLRPLTDRLYGCELPKQFATLVGGRSLLQTTLDRIARLVPAERTVVIVGERHREVADRQLGGYRGLEVVTQPRNLGTAPGILLPLARVRARDPNAAVAIFPSDHHVARPCPLLAGIRTALEATRHGGGMALIGAEADRPETEYGWIVPDRAPRGALSGPGSAAARPGAVPVSRFVEKPDAGLAARLLRQGGLWNTFMIAGLAHEIWEAARRRMPRTIELFESYVGRSGHGDDRVALAELYDRLEPGDFSRDVLEHTWDLSVVPVRDCGWSDWGSPQRVFESLRGRPAYAELERRLARAPEPLAVAL